MTLLVGAGMELVVFMMFLCIFHERLGSSRAPIVFAKDPAFRGESDD